MMMMVAACGGDDASGEPDAAPGDAAAVDGVDVDAPEGLACLGQAPVATAPDPMTVEGQVFVVVGYEVAPAAGATVDVRRRAGGAVVGSAATGVDGRFTMEVATGGVALDVWFEVEAAGRLPTHGFPGEPLRGGENAFLLVADAAEVGGWYGDAGETYAAGMRTVVVSVKDCENGSPAGVTAAVAPMPGSVVYYDDQAQRWDPQLAAATNGFVLLGDAAAEIAVAPSIGGVTLPAREVAPAADAVTLLLATPRTAPP